MESLFASMQSAIITNASWYYVLVVAVILVSVLITLLDFAICYPIAYYMAHVATGGKSRLLVLCLILPFWVNEILRAFASWTSRSTS